ncbi:TPA: hypothetical protein LC430_005050 [Salmonella enterica subsp. enterica serovar Duisburg]|nr:hypothetical protein AO411_2029095 [Salmonella enterica subsp. enterica serovar Sarajane]HBJ6962278.1 hypothetical protein [Salmonella enterica subsp. enterica serovar Duisburg]
MKLNLSDIKFSGSGYVSTTVEVGVGPYSLLLSTCTMHVSVPLVEGKTLEQYKEELLAQARERIARMYKEIVCGGEPDDEIVVTVHGKLSVAGAEDASSSDEPGVDEELWGWGFRIEDREGVLVVCDENGESEPTSEHRDKIIERVIRELKSGNRNMLKRLGRSMGLLQVAADIEAANQLCGSARREHVLKDFDNPPFKKVPDDWISPGVEYIKTRLGEGAREDELIISSIYDVARKAAADFIASRKQ